ncbi:MAG: glutamine synthetase family protein [Bacteroidetes bacterium]|nr:glutamine synthetase family protein [Bacteroidota bacterium]
MSLALTNPITLLTGKDPHDLTRQDLMNILVTRQIERITFHYTALDGKLKELKIPVQNRKQAERILANGERADGSSLFKGLVDAAVSDLYVIPDYKTAFLNPFDPGSLDFICRFINRNGERVPFALDNVVHKAHEFFKKSTGYELHALGELEFFLIRKEEDHLFPNPKQRGYHASSPFAKSGSVLNEMLNHISSITGAVKYGHYEVGYVENLVSELTEINGKQAEQVEIEFLPVPADEMGDHLVLARWIIRNVAYRHGMVATFTPKLEEGIAGSGLHVHMALMKNGHNQMVRPEGTLSDPALKVIGGLCRYADSLTAFGNTVASSYLRLVPDQEAPTRVCWSDMNRSAMVRVPLGWSNVPDLAKLVNPAQTEPYLDADSRQTVELRTGDGSAYVHLLLAGIILAAESGLADAAGVKTAEELYVRGNIFENKEIWNRLTPLPKSCVESARLLLEKRNLYEKDGIFPTSLIEYLARQLSAEYDENLNRQLAALPPDDRLKETRKVLHKDLHLH